MPKNVKQLLLVDFVSLSNFIYFFQYGIFLLYKLLSYKICLSTFCYF